MALPSFAQIFTDTGSDGLATTFREFLGYFVKQFWPGVSTQIDKLYFTRLDYPLLVYPFFLLAALGLFSFWEKPTARNALFAAIPAGLLFYVYFHTWVYWLTVIGFLALYVFFIAPRDAERRRGMAVLLVAIGAMAVPYLINYYRFIQFPDHQDFIRRLWLTEGREVALLGLGFDYLTYLALAVAVYLLYFTRNRQKAMLFWACLAAMAAVWNVQLVTGFAPTPDHWTKAVSPMLYILIAAMGYEVVSRLEVRRPSLRSVVGIGLILLSALVVTKKVVNVVSLEQGLQPWVAAKHTFPQDVADSWQWINANLPREPKIISSAPMTSQYLSVYTSARPYIPLGIISALPMRDIETRWLVASRLFRVPESVLRAEVDREPVPCRGASCYDAESNFLKVTDDLYACFFSRGPFNTNQRQGCGKIPADYAEALLSRYRRTEVSWDDVASDYVYYGPWEKQFSDPDFRHDLRLTLLYENPMVEIYKIRRETQAENGRGQ